MSRMSSVFIQNFIDNVFYSLLKETVVYDSLDQVTVEPMIGRGSTVKDPKQLRNIFVEYHLCELISLLECKYPIEFDACLSRLCDSNNSLKNQLTTQQKNQFLTTISCRFALFKCKTTFKYQQMDLGSNNNKSSELSLLMALQHTNQAVRANGLNYILKQLNDNKKTTFHIDEHFIKEALVNKFNNEWSPVVLQEIVDFKKKLLHYFTLENLIGDNDSNRESYLVRLFNEESFEENAETKIDWQLCHQSTINLIFDTLFNKDSENRDLFFNCFLLIVNKLFQFQSLDLLKHLKTTKYFEYLNSEIHGDKSSSITFDSTKTPSISSFNKKMNGTTNGHGNDANNSNDKIELNDYFDKYISIIVKYMLSNSNKVDKNKIKLPSLFKNIDQHQQLNFFHLVTFEICLRLCAQSLFMTNSITFLTLSTEILMNKVASLNFKWQSKKSLSESIKADNHQTESRSLEQYLNLIKYSKQNSDSVETTKANSQSSLTQFQFVTNLYLSLFKIINIQSSNFAKSDAVDIINNKYELEILLNRIYIQLCLKSTEISGLFLSLKFLFLRTFFFKF
jgi:hypothetical protein